MRKVISVVLCSDEAEVVVVRNEFDASNAHGLSSCNSHRHALINTPIASPMILSRTMPSKRRSCGLRSAAALSIALSSADVGGGELASLPDVLDGLQQLQAIAQLSGCHFNRTH
jgi:hypothetical protein